MSITAVSDGGLREQERAVIQAITRKSVSRGRSSRLLHIADFSEDGRLGGSGCAGDITGLLEPCLVREYGEGNGFFGLGGEAKVVCFLDAKFVWREFFFDHAHESWIFSSAAGDEEVVIALFALALGEETDGGTD